MVEVCCRFLPGEQRVVEKEHQLAETAEHDYDRYKTAPITYLVHLVIPEGHDI